MWFTTNKLGERDEQQISSKSLLYLTRAEGLIKEEKTQNWEKLISAIFAQQLNRDFVLDTVLNGLQLIELGLEPLAVGDIIMHDIERMQKVGMISLIEGCMIRDSITEFNKLGIDFSTCLPVDSYLNPKHEIYHAQTTIQRVR